SFFWSSASASARSARCFHRTISCSCSAICLSRGSGGVAFPPRGFGDSPASSPRSRAARQVVRCDEYNPSRRSSAPISPGCVQRSASRTIRRLYSAVKRRRCALATTSVSPTTGAALGEPPVALRAPSASPSCSIPSPRSHFSTTAIHRCLPALYSKLSPPRCLTLVGTEGRGPAAIAAQEQLPDGLDEEREERDAGLGVLTNLRRRDAVQRLEALPLLRRT